jgi:8-oxo-dGTP pyrophosphatase MutT (NUDIX family)
VITKKVCPLVVRQATSRLEVLAFEYPLAGKQLIKGSIEENENELDAAKRELCEESGLHLDNDFIFLIRSTEIVCNQEWVFFRGKTGGLPDRWDHFCHDDRGHWFRLFWQPLDQPLSDDWHISFRNVFKLIRSVRVNDKLI